MSQRHESRCNNSTTETITVVLIIEGPESVVQHNRKAVCSHKTITVSPRGLVHT